MDKKVTKKKVTKKTVKKPLKKPMRKAETVKVSVRLSNAAAADLAKELTESAEDLGRDIVDYAAGADFQKWVHCEAGSWWVDITDVADLLNPDVLYRRTPGPEYRPYTESELRDMVGTIVKQQPGVPSDIARVAMIIDFIGPDTVYVGSRTTPIDAKTLLRDWRLAVDNSRLGEPLFKFELKA